MNFKHFESIVSCTLTTQACCADGLRSIGDERVQYAGIYARGVEGCWQEKASFIWKTCAGNWIYQKDFVGGVQQDFQLVLLLTNVIASDPRSGERSNLSLKGEKDGRTIGKS